MKTSNKILLGFFGFFAFLALTSMIYLRANLTEQVDIDTSDWITQIRPTEPFTRIEARTAVDIVISEGEPKLELNGSTDMLDKVDVYFNEGTLVIKEKDGVNLRSSHKFKVKVRADSLTYVEHSGAGTIESSGTLNYPDWQISTHGAISVMVEIAAEKFHVHNTGAGSTSVSGTADYASFHNSGAGSTDAENLVANSVDVHNSGAGTASVHALEQLNVNLSGFGNVRYKGNPRIQQSISGMGNVSSM